MSFLAVEHSHYPASPASCAAPWFGAGVAALAASAPAALAGAVDWSEQHERQMRVGVVHAAADLPDGRPVQAAAAGARPGWELAPGREDMGILRLRRSDLSTAGLAVPRVL